jgi:clan AA aspartic protease (TIGR02281 family)
MSRWSVFLGLALLALAPGAARVAGGAGVADLNDAGKQAYERGDYARAERLFGQAIAQTPANPLLHYHRGVALSRLSRWDEAAQSYQTALRLNPPPALAASVREALRSVTALSGSPGRSQRGPVDLSIPLRREGGGWLAEVMVNGTRTARFLVDTGASVCIISPDLAREVGVTAASGARTVQLETLSGRTSGSLVSISSLRVGDVESQDVPAVIHDTGPRMDGILGNTFLGRFTVTVDPDRSVLTLRPR